MPFCGKCGANLPEGSKFCGVCGEPVPSADASQTSSTDQQPDSATPSENPTYQQPESTPPYQPTQPEATPHEPGVTDYTSRMDPNDILQNKTLCGLAYVFPILFFLPLVSCPNSKFGRFHANQALLLFLLNLCVMIIVWIPILRWIIGGICGIFSLVLWILGMVYSFSGQANELLLIGSLRIIK